MLDFELGYIFSPSVVSPFLSGAVQRQLQYPLQVRDYTGVRVCVVRAPVQVSSPLIRRVTQVDTRFIKQLEFEPRVAAEFDFHVDSEPVLQAIDQLDFYELKGKPGHQRRNAVSPLPL